MKSFLEKIKTGIGLDAKISKVEESLDGEKQPSNENPKKIKVEKKKAEPKKSRGFQEKTGEAKEGEKKIKEERWFEQEGQLAVDVYQTEEELVIQSAIAGIKSEDLEISTQGDVITIKGEREKPAETGEINYFYQECYWGPFSREIILPLEADAGRAKATMKEGILTIRMPKIEKEKEKKIVVKER